MQARNTFLAAALLVPLAAAAFELASPDLAPGEAIPTNYYWNNFGSRERSSPSMILLPSNVSLKAHEKMSSASRRTCVNAVSIAS